MKHISQLFEYVTGMDTRIGYPTEHLAKGNAEDVTSPMYATGIGLVIKGFQKLEKQRDNKKSEKGSYAGPSKSKKKLSGKNIEKRTRVFRRRRSLKIKNQRHEI